MNDLKVRIMLEVIVDMNRLTEIGRDFISQAVTQLTAHEARRTAVRVFGEVLNLRK